ncbi:C1q and tumor necrosis factor protein 3 [Cichlidogyrus casuarinus]|uniref:C1q and tumor necrosis factor protein 3 n=1 Tax=Cichlidogyrus casuarinus TaxID=1844966 RepID=A0ABD2PUI8_9PLAT
MDLYAAGPPGKSEVRWVPYPAAVHLTMMADQQNKNGNRTVFDVAVYELGFSYDKMTGEITVPIDGVYYLGLSVSAMAYEEAHIAVVNDGSLKLEAFSSSKPWGSMANQGVFPLKKGSKIWFEYAGMNKYFKKGYCTFTAFLLFPLDTPHPN